MKAGVSASDHACKEDLLAVENGRRPWESLLTVVELMPFSSTTQQSTLLDTHMQIDQDWVALYYDCLLSTQKASQLSQVIISIRKASQLSHKG